MDNPLISVIVPVYNVEKYLDRCVESIVNQTYTNLEIILVDDGSPDNCPAMCDAWAERDNRIKVIHKENGGVSSARNIGIKAATGDYISFVDSDDYISALMFETLYSNFDLDIDLVCSLYYDFDLVKAPHINEFVKRFFVYQNCEDLLIKGNRVALENYFSGLFISFSPFGKLYKNRIITDNNILFDESKKIGEDYIFNYYYLLHSHSVISLNNYLYYYFQRSDSAFHNISINVINRWENNVELLSSIEQIFGRDRVFISCLKWHFNDLFSILKQLLLSNNKTLIKLCYCDLQNEIANRYKDFLKYLDLSYFQLCKLNFIRLFPKMFLCIYSLYLRMMY